MMYDAGGDICQKEAKQVKCPTFILHPGTDLLLFYMIQAPLLQRLGLRVP